MIIYSASYNNRVYIGQTIQPFQIRKMQHRYDMSAGVDTLFHNALRKYGFENFEWKILYYSDILSKTLHDEIERHFIRLYKSNEKEHGFNLTPGGNGWKGYQPSKLNRKSKRKKKEPKIKIVENKVKRPRKPHSEKALFNMRKAQRRRHSIYHIYF